jgi:hypothetical protein
LVQDGIKKVVCEPGWDGLSVNGQFIQNGLVGYEIKDKLLIGRVMPECPQALRSINDAMSPILKEMGCAGHWSTEIKITKDGKLFFLDPTLRVPSPPGEAFNVIYKNYPQACSDVAHGRLPSMKYDKRYFVEIMLYSSIYEEEQICVEFPEELKDNIKLKNHTKSKDKDGEYYTVIPNDNGGYFGGVVATGDSIEEAEKSCLEIIGQITAEGIEYSTDGLCKAKEAIEAGKEWIKF